MKLAVVDCASLAAIVICCPAGTKPDTSGNSCSQDLLKLAQRCWHGESKQGWAHKVIWPEGPGYARTLAKSGPLGCALCWKRAAEYYFDPVVGMDRDFARRVMDFCEAGMISPKRTGEYLLHVRSRPIYCGSGMCRRCVLCAVQGRTQLGKSECEKC